MRRPPLSSVLALALLLAVVVAGCMHGGDSSTGGDAALRQAQFGDPWMALTKGCAPCEEDPDLVEAETVVYYESGHGLWYSFGLGEAGGSSTVETEPGVEEWQAEIAAVAAKLGNWYTQGRTIHVHEVLTERLGDEAWGRMQGILAEHESAVQDPGDPRYGCEECRGPTVELLRGNRMVAELWPRDPGAPGTGNYDANQEDPWHRLLKQMESIRVWVNPDTA